MSNRFPGGADGGHKVRTTDREESKLKLQKGVDVVFSCS